MANVKVLTSKVSSNVLNMQFMKRTAQQQEKYKKELTERSLETNLSELRIYPVVQTISDKPTCSIGSVFNEERFSVLETLRFGRFSYKGQNPEVENLMIYHENKRLGIETEENYVEELENGELDDTIMNSNSFHPLLNEVYRKEFVEVEDQNKIIQSKKKIEKHHKKFNINLTEKIVVKCDNDQLPSVNPLYVFASKKKFNSKKRNIKTVGNNNEESIQSKKRKKY